MPTYADPWRYSEKTRRLEDMRRKLLEDVRKGTEAQRYNKVFGQFTEKQRSGVKAIDEMLNRKEAEAEVLNQQIMDQYPGGATGDGLMSRNIAPYGMPPQPPVDPSMAMQAQEQMAKGAAPIPLVPNPFYREGGILPKLIPADLAAQLVQQSQAK